MPEGFPRRGVMNRYVSPRRTLSVAYDGGMSEEERRLRYAIGQVYLAVSDLVGPGEVRERLVDAYMTHLMTISPDDFPGHLRNNYRSIREALTWLPPTHPGQGKLRFTVAHMSEEEAVLLAQKLVGMLFDLVDLKRAEGD